MTDLRVIGIDPGPVPGVVVLDLCDRHDGEGRWLEAAHVLQCTAGLLDELLTQLLKAYRAPTLLQVERFVVGRRSSRSSTASAGARTRDMVGEVLATARGHADVLQRSAAAVKPWATDLRLERAAACTDTTLWQLTAGMRHARDAARHALFAACHDGGLPDPMSKEYAR